MESAQVHRAPTAAQVPMYTFVEVLTILTERPDRHEGRHHRDAVIQEAEWTEWPWAGYLTVHDYARTHVVMHSEVSWLEDLYAQKGHWHRMTSNVIKHSSSGVEFHQPDLRWLPLALLQSFSVVNL